MGTQRSKILTEEEVCLHRLYHHQQDGDIYCYLWAMEFEHLPKQRWHTFSLYILWLSFVHYIKITSKKYNARKLRSQMISLSFTKYSKLLASLSLDVVNYKM